VTTIHTIWQNNSKTKTLPAKHRFLDEFGIIFFVLSECAMKRHSKGKFLPYRIDTIIINSRYQEHVDIVFEKSYLVKIVSLIEIKILTTRESA